MSVVIPSWVFNTCFVLLAFALICIFYRMVKGPTPADRAVASDALGVVVMSSVMLYSIRMQSTEYFSAVLVIAILGFIGLTLIAKFLGGGDAIDHDK